MRCNMQPELCAKLRLATLRRMADVSRAGHVRPASECVFSYLADGENRQFVAEARQERREGRAALRDLREARLAVAGHGLAVRVPGERVPEHDLVRAARAVEL